MTRGMRAAAIGLLVVVAQMDLRAQQAGAQQPPPTNRTPAPTQPQQTAPAVPRTFSTPAGLLFNTVRPERVEDFEKVIAYLQAAFEKTTDPVIRKQASGWRVFKATEPGSNGTVLYVFVLDPTVANADYSLGRILADAYPDTAQLQEIWRLYTSSVTSGGTLLNLSPVSPDPSSLTQPSRSAPQVDPATAKPPATAPSKPQSPPATEPAR